MSLTKEDIQLFKELLNTQKEEISADTERKITTAVTNLERSLESKIMFRNAMLADSLRRELHTSEDNIKKELKDYIDNRLKQVDSRFEQIDNRFKQLDETLKKAVRQLEDRIFLSEKSIIQTHGDFIEEYENRFMKIEKHVGLTS